MERLGTRLVVVTGVQDLLFKLRRIFKLHSGLKLKRNQILVMQKWSNRSWNVSSLTSPRSRGSSCSNSLTATWKCSRSWELWTERKDLVETAKLRAGLCERPIGWLSIKDGKRLARRRSWVSEWYSPSQRVSAVPLCRMQTPKKIIQKINFSLLSVKFYLMDINSIYLHFCVYNF